MDDHSVQHQSHLFTVRLWQENLGDGRQEWRGKVKYLLSNEEITFRGCEDVGELLLSLLPGSIQESKVARRKQ
jgi:hypothetical protein